MVPSCACLLLVTYGNVRIYHVVLVPLRCSRFRLMTDDDRLRVQPSVAPCSHCLLKLPTLAPTPMRRSASNKPQEHQANDAAFSHQLNRWGFRFRLPKGRSRRSTRTWHHPQFHRGAAVRALTLALETGRLVDLLDDPDTDAATNREAMDPGEGLKRRRTAGQHDSIIPVGKRQRGPGNKIKVGHTMSSDDNKNVTNPGPNDNLCGRGGGINTHPGNIKFRKLVAAHKLRYLAASKLDKLGVARDVVCEWRAMDPPGRFLAKLDKSKLPDGGDSRTGLWVEIGDERAWKKTGQALRERLPEIVRAKRQAQLQMLAGVPLAAGVESSSSPDQNNGYFV